jgi:AcrR family transcriptional regulator
VSPRPSVEGIRRDEILRAACAVIVERGYAATRVSDIARLSGTSSASVYYYFKTKHNVLTEALAFAGRRAYAEHQEALEAIAGMSDRLVRLVDWQIPEGKGRDNWTMWLEVWNEATRRRDVREAQEVAYRAWLEALEEVIAAGVAAGEFRPVDAKDFAATLAALVDGFGIQVLAGTSLTPKRMRSLIVRFLRDQLFAEASLPATAGLGRT